MKLGLTGHQHLGGADNVKWVRETLQKVIIGLDNISMGISALAVGADQLFVELLLDKSVPYRVIIPCGSYEKVFKDLEQQKYYSLLETAISKEQLTYNEPCEEAFEAAGKKVVDQADLLLAVWNGIPAKGLSGIGDIVNYAKTKGKEIIQVNPLQHLVTYL